MSADQPKATVDWNGPVLIERDYWIGNDQIAITVRLGFPRQAERSDEWACSFQLFGWGDSQVKVARGSDGLQALTIATEAIRQRLDDAGNVTSSSDVPYEFVFPRYVPFAHGLEYHRNSADCWTRR